MVAARYGDDRAFYRPATMFSFSVRRVPLPFSDSYLPVLTTAGEYLRCGARATLRAQLCLRTELSAQRDIEFLIKGVGFLYFDRDGEAIRLQAVGAREPFV